MAEQTEPEFSAYLPCREEQAGVALARLLAEDEPGAGHGLPVPVPVPQQAEHREAQQKPGQGTDERAAGNNGWLTGWWGGGQRNVPGAPAPTPAPAPAPPASAAGAVQAVRDDPAFNMVTVCIQAPHEECQAREAALTRQAEELRLRAAWLEGALLTHARQGEAARKESSTAKEQVKILRSALDKERLRVLKAVLRARLARMCRASKEQAGDTAVREASSAKEQVTALEAANVRLTDTISILQGKIRSQKHALTVCAREGASAAEAGQARMEDLEAQLRVVQGQLKDAEAGKKGYLQKCTALKGRVHALEGQVASLEAQLALSQLAQSQLAQSQLAQAQLAQAQAQGAEAAAGREKAELEAMVEQLRDQLALAEEGAKDWASSYAEARQQLRELRTHAKEARLRDAQAHQLTEKLAASEASYKNLQTAYDALQQQLDGAASGAAAPHSTADRDRLRIIHAWYGDPSSEAHLTERRLDVTDMVRSLVKQGPDGVDELHIDPGSEPCHKHFIMNDLFGDPCYGTAKVVVVRCAYDSSTTYDTATPITAREAEGLRITRESLTMEGKAESARLRAQLKESQDKCALLAQQAREGELARTRSEETPAGVVVPRPSTAGSAAGSASAPVYPTDEERVALCCLIGRRFPDQCEEDSGFPHSVARAVFWAAKGDYAAATRIIATSSFEDLLNIKWQYSIPAGSPRVSTCQPDAAACGAPLPRDYLHVTHTQAPGLLGDSDPQARLVIQGLLAAASRGVQGYIPYSVLLQGPAGAGGQALGVTTAEQGETATGEAQSGTEASAGSRDRSNPVGIALLWFSPPNSTGGAVPAAASSSSSRGDMGPGQQLLQAVASYISSPLGRTAQALSTPSSFSITAYGVSTRPLPEGFGVPSMWRLRALGGGGAVSQPTGLPLKNIAVHGAAGVWPGTVLHTFTLQHIPPGLCAPLFGTDLRDSEAATDTAWFTLPVTHTVSGTGCSAGTGGRLLLEVSNPGEAPESWMAQYLAALPERWSFLSTPLPQ